MREGMSGADWVIHAAAELDLAAAGATMAAANVEGSENVASLAPKLGVPRFLSISSMAAWGGSPADGTPGGRSLPAPQLPLPTRYWPPRRRARAIQQLGAAGAQGEHGLPRPGLRPAGQEAGGQLLSCGR